MLSLSFLLLFHAFILSSSQVTYLCNSEAPCGRSTNPVVKTKIVGGETAPLNAWGWAVSFSINDTWLCGGSILSSSWILTAAHCLQDMLPSEVFVSAATNQLFGMDQGRLASSIIIHPEYDSENIENDIALIKVSRPFIMTDPAIAKICLPMSTTEDYPPINSTLVAIGWGQLAENGDVSETLQQVTIQRIPYESDTCYPSVTNESMQFCAGVENGGKGVCHGDSGGSLMLFTSSQQWVVVGIVSYGYGCAQSEYAAVYTRVVYYLDWIHSMNVTDAVTVDIVTTTTQTHIASNLTNDGLSYHEHFSLLFFIAPIMLISLTLFSSNALYFSF